jgi:hypothetical protein
VGLETNSLCLEFVLEPKTKLRILKFSFGVSKLNS